jgi:hypothetical protein
MTESASVSYVKAYTEHLKRLTHEEYGNICPEDTIPKPVKISEPAWIAHLENGNVLIQCAEKTLNPRHHDVFIVFYTSKHPNIKRLPEEFRISSHNTFVILPNWIVGKPPTRIELGNIELFYSKCPRHVFKAIKLMFWKTIIPECDAEHSVSDIVRHPHHHAPPIVKNYKVDKEKTRLDESIYTKIERDTNFV